MFEVNFILKLNPRFKRIYFFDSNTAAVSFISLLKKVYPVSSCSLIPDCLVYDMVVYHSADEAFANLSNRLRHAGELR